MSNAIPLNPEVIGLYRDFLEHPEKHADVTTSRYKGSIQGN